MSPDTEGTARPPLPVAPVRRTVPRIDAKKSFTGAKAVDRMKGYLRDVPVLHKRLTTVIEEQERHLAQAKEALGRFETVTKDIEQTVKSWEEEQHGRGSQERDGDGSAAGGDASGSGPSGGGQSDAPPPAPEAGADAPAST